MNACIHLFHAVSRRASLTSAAEWQRLAREALKEYDRLLTENAELKKQVKNFGPKFQGMTDLA